MPGSPPASHNEVLAARMLWAQCAFGRIVPLPLRPPPAGRPIRVAYLSAFFGERNWMKPVFSMIHCHDRQRFEIHLVSDGDDPSPAAGYQARTGDRIWQVRGMPNDHLANHLAAAGIDVIVDLNGYSLRHRLGLFPYRAARRQFGWFNTFATTGVPGFDALIGDDAAVPAAEEAFYSEPILRVPGSYLAFRVPYPTPPVAPPPCLASGRLTFGCLGSSYKLTPETLAAWAAILRAAPGARLLVKNPLLDEPSNRAALLDRLTALGIEAGRVTLSGRAEHFDFLRAYHGVDIALDTFPYNGGTTTSEALWQGVPVLTCNGDRWAGRTSRSLLLAAGLDDWVAADMDGFVATGIRLATDPATPEMLGRLRAGLRPLLAASAACDSPGLCASLEAIYTSPE
jgi:predicted O-linked N-acetylglucosamine transferase (SPINDLY family)